ncbi:U-box domain-containing protein 16-like [Canna indica]|uniref:U-box domain-containing protein 16-like n=1 Tax=Canna indica TaxID=4628 RepID=A0AAQ3L4S3_9LILI|nr:U-box domain-containing protein 16-like [Canna indica]
MGDDRGHRANVDKGYALSDPRANDYLSTGVDNYTFAAEAGVIPLILPLLRSTEAELQVNTVMLNLSIMEANKRQIMHANYAIDGLIHVLEEGASWLAKENAASIVLGLSSVHPYRCRFPTAWRRREKSYYARDLAKADQNGTNPVRVEDCWVMRFGVHNRVYRVSDHLGRI